MHLPRGSEQSNPKTSVRRVRLIFALAAIVIGVFWVRAFYLQIIRHDYYVQAARSDQLKEYQIPAPRGIIKVHHGDDEVPIVLNQKLYTVFADPTLIKDAPRVAETLAAALGGKTSEYEAKLKTEDTRYVVLAKKVADDVRKEILKHEYPGIGAQENAYRTYPNGSLAAQLLGFVNDEGRGVYGLEQAMNDKLEGEPGQLKAITDARGVPLAANSENIKVKPVNGHDLLLTIDLAMQKQLENILERGLERAKSQHGSAIIMDPKNGAIKAMANWPTFDPGNYSSVEDVSVFANAAVTKPLEIGSIMKPLTAAIALDLGVIRPDTTYIDPGVLEIDGSTISNVEGGGFGQHNIAQLLNLSLNTGTVWLLMQMSQPGGMEINQQGRERLHEYLTEHFRFGQRTGIEQGYEAEGFIPDPNEGYARNLTYANVAFGQAMTATPLQVAAAFSAMLNGGTYYQPRLIDQIINPDGSVTSVKPKILKEGVVSPQVSEQIQPLMEYVVENHRVVGQLFDQEVYSVGGKTGTAQVAGPDGRYKEHDFNGTYAGFVGGDEPEYVIVVVTYEPQIPGYAGSVGAQPIFGELAEMLIDNFGVTPRSR